MSQSKKLVTVTIAALVGLGLASTTSAMVKAPADKEKCYGVVKAGKNDCGNANHDCAAMAKKDGDADEWVFVSKGVCSRLVGGTTK